MPTSTPNPDLDYFVDAYESACEGGLRTGIDLREFVPAIDHPEYAEIVVELCRVDLERHWDDAEQNRLSRYQQLFPDLYQDPGNLERLAFEEYRLRRSAGEAVNPEEYLRRFGLNVDSWPRGLQRDIAGAAELTTSPAFQELSRIQPESASRLADAARDFPQPGESFLGFQLLSELGRGSFGRVFLARQGDLANRLVALKVTMANAVEPQRLARLQHTHITPIFSAHRRRNLQAVCMPFLGRNTLADVIRRMPAGSVPQDTRDLIHTITEVATGHPTPIAAEHGSPMAIVAPSSPTAAVNGEIATVAAAESPQLKKLAQLNYVEAACWLIAQIADGLAHAHDRGVLHCDLKPANILLSDDGQPVILDFSTAQDLSRAGGCSAMLGGTLPYMSPEQITAFQGRATIDARSDLYSLGVVFHELLIGKLPFPIRSGPLDDTLANMIADRRGPVRLISEQNASISGGLSAILRHCLEFDRTQRYQSARQLHEDLMRHLDHLPLRHVREPSVGERLQKWSYRHPRLASSSLVATVACLLVALVTTAWWVRTRQVARLEAEQRYQRVLETMPTVWVEAAANSLNADRQEEFRRRAQEIYSTYKVKDAAPWYDAPAVSLLSRDNQRRLREEIGGVLYLDAELRLREAQRLPAPDRDTVLTDARRLHQLAASALRGAQRPQVLEQQAAELFSAAGTAGHRERPDPRDNDQISATPLDNLWQASRSVMREQWSHAERLLLEVVRKDPRNYSARFLLGNCQAQQGKSIEADGTFSTCIALRSEEYAGWYHRGLVRLDRLDFAAAKDDFSAVLERRPEMVEAYVNRALASGGCGEMDQAIQDLTEAIARGSRQTRLWLLRSQYRARAGDHAGSQLDYDEWSRRTPTDELSWVTRGVSKIAADPQGAIQDFQNALSLNPRSRPALQNLAHVLSERLDDNAAAVAVLGDALVKQPRDSVLLGSRGVLLARLDKSAEALADANAACVAGANDGFAWFQAACVRSLLASHAMKHHLEEASQHRQAGARCLARALVKRPDLAALIGHDRDLDGLREDPRCKSLIEAAMLMLQTAESHSSPSAP